MDIKIVGVSIPATKTRVGLRFEQGERVPSEGETVVMHFRGGYYAVTIHTITQLRKHEDGAWLMTARATKRLVVNMPVEDEGEETK